jgi:hypothetical protein
LVILRSFGISFLPFWYFLPRKIWHPWFCREVDNPSGLISKCLVTTQTQQRSGGEGFSPDILKSNICTRQVHSWLGLTKIPGIVCSISWMEMFIWIKNSTKNYSLIYLPGFTYIWMNLKVKYKSK